MYSDFNAIARMHANVIVVDILTISIQSSVIGSQYLSIHSF